VQKTRIVSLHFEKAQMNLILSLAKGFPALAFRWSHDFPDPVQTLQNDVLFARAQDFPEFLLLLHFLKKP